MGLLKRIDELKWRAIYLNGEDSGYKISNDGFIVYGNKAVEEPYIRMGDKVFKIDKNYVMASAFMENPYQYECVRDWGLLEWYTDKTLIKNAILDEMEYYENPKPMEGTEEERVRKACKFMENPEMRLPYISAITGISKADLYEIRMGNKWNDIARNYIFPIRNYPCGDKRYTISQIHEVCKMLSDTKTFRQILINRVTGVNPYTINLIRFRKTYQMISMFYEFCYKEIDHAHANDPDLYSPQQVRHACFMLENPFYTYKQISEFCNMNLAVLYKIRDRKLFNEIGKEFNTQMPRLRNNSEPYTNRIMQLISEGRSTWEIANRIQIEFRMGDRQKVIDSVDEINKTYFNVNSSTTIPNDPDKYSARIDRIVGSGSSGHATAKWED